MNFDIFCNFLIRIMGIKYIWVKIIDTLKAFLKVKIIIHHLWAIKEDGLLKNGI